MMRQKTQPAVTRFSSSCILGWTRSETDQSSKETGHGHLPQVQAEDSQERQSREARIDLVSQDVPCQGGLPREVAAISRLASATSVDVRPHLPDLVVLSPFDARRVLGRTAWVE